MECTIANLDDPAHRVARGADADGLEHSGAAELPEHVRGVEDLRDPCFMLKESLSAMQAKRRKIRDR